MKYFTFVLAIVVALGFWLAGGNADDALLADVTPEVVVPIQVTPESESGSLVSEVDFHRVDTILADITAQLNQPNILKTDILRGWYLGSESEKKYGTPDTWIFVEDGVDSKWMSPNSLDEEEFFDDQQLCKETAGMYVSSCLESTETDCDYVDASYCQCLTGSRWKDGEGCILMTERGAYVSINNSEIEKGWYYGLPNEKKLNTPSDWVWIEHGRESAWQAPTH